MSYADIYVIQETRSKSHAIDFLNHFLPHRVESASEYLIPQYSDNPIQSFDNADELMEFLENNVQFNQSIYWRNTDEDSLNKHGMVFYTRDGNMILGISRDADMTGGSDTKNEQECLKEMKAYFKTDIGYIDYENPPIDTYNEFVKRARMSM